MTDSSQTIFDFLQHGRQASAAGFIESFRDLAVSMIRDNGRKTPYFMKKEMLEIEQKNTDFVDPALKVTE